eukprot:10694351-Heterocapsa_arctica.AAC.1
MVEHAACAQQVAYAALLHAATTISGDHKNLDGPSAAQTKLAWAIDQNGKDRIKAKLAAEIHKTTASIPSGHDAASMSAASATA